MKTLGSLLKSAAALFAVTALVTTASAANPGALKGSAEIYKISGGATVNGAPAYKGQIVKEGSTIVTGPGSEVSIDLGVNGGQLTIKANSTLSLDKLDIKGADTGETFLDLKEGKVSGNAKKISAASKYEIKTAKGVAGIRGTSFIIGSDGTTSVTGGTVVVIFVINGVQSPPVTLNAGQTAIPPTTPGGAPTVVANPPGLPPPPPPRDGGTTDVETTITVKKDLPPPDPQPPYKTEGEKDREG
ncbi:MAG: FecR domain-containing protein [Verrucomicrobia bacterium]|nr:FecR domain-containing protein [Verrucomicrobiota bacterium]